jgi:hypothetical protein
MFNVLFAKTTGKSQKVQHLFQSNNSTLQITKLPWFLLTFTMLLGKHSLIN